MTIDIAVLWSLKKIADTFLSEAVKDAYEGLANFMGRIAVEKAPAGGLRGRDNRPRANVRVHPGDNLPAKAFSALASMGIEALPPGERWFERDAGVDLPSGLICLTHSTRRPTGPC